MINNVTQAVRRGWDTGEPRQGKHRSLPLPGPEHHLREDHSPGPLKPSHTSPPTPPPPPPPPRPRGKCTVTSPPLGLGTGIAPAPVEGSSVISADPSSG